MRWLTDYGWGGVLALAELPRFAKLPGDIEENPSRFLDWYQHPTPERERLPLQWRDLDKCWFHKLLVIRYLRPDRMIPALRIFIQEVLPKANAFLNLDAEFSSFQVNRLSMCAMSRPCGNSIFSRANPHLYTRTGSGAGVPGQ